MKHRQDSILSSVLNTIAANNGTMWLFFRGGGPRHLGAKIEESELAHPRCQTLCGRTGNYAYTATRQRKRISCATCRMILLAAEEPE